MKSFLSLSALGLLSTMVNVQAAIISSETVDTEIGNGNFANLQGLEWLSLDETAGQSRDQIEAGYGGLLEAGWRYATISETETLLTSLWGGHYDLYAPDNALGAYWFGQVFGFIGYGGAGPDDVYNSDAWTNLDRAYFFYGAEGESCVDDFYSCWGQVRYAENYAWDHWSRNLETGEMHVAYAANSGPIGYLSEKHGVVMGTTDENNGQYRGLEDSTYGSLLVRETAVPEPSAISLLSLALLGLVSVRFCKTRDFNKT